MALNTYQRLPLSFLRAPALLGLSTAKIDAIRRRANLESLRRWQYWLAFACWAMWGIGGFAIGKLLLPEWSLLGGRLTAAELAGLFGFQVGWVQFGVIAETVTAISLCKQVQDRESG